jgi:hypothetical protein
MCHRTTYPPRQYSSRFSVCQRRFGWICALHFVLLLRSTSIKQTSYADFHSFNTYLARREQRTYSRQCLRPCRHHSPPVIVYVLDSFLQAKTRLLWITKSPARKLLVCYKHVCSQSSGSLPPDLWQKGSSHTTDCHYRLVRRCLSSAAEKIEETGG